MAPFPPTSMTLRLTDLAARIETRAMSSVAMTRALLDRISSLGGTLHSYALVCRCLVRTFSCSPIDRSLISLTAAASARE